MQNKLIICPNSEKIKILKNLNNNDNLHNIKFMTKKEFLSNYFFKYDEKALFYLMSKYNLHIDVAKAYLDLLYGIELDNVYSNRKLEYLKIIKKDLIDNNLLIFSNGFKKYISKMDIEVKNYYDLDLYEEKALNYKFNLKSNNINSSVYEFSSIEEEVNFVCIKIVELLKNGIDISKIHLCNVTNDYFYIIKKLFSYYKIPINIPFKNSIYGTKKVKDYLEKGILDLNSNDEVTKKLVSVLNSLADLDNNSEIYRKILEEKIKTTYLTNKKLDKAVSINNIYEDSFDSDDHVFVVGFNQDVLPSIRKDIEYITDKEKCEVEMYTTIYLNKREKEILTYVLSNINNLYLSYKLSTPFKEFYKSSLISELNLEVIKDYEVSYNHSNFYNKILLGEMLDNFKLYGEKDRSLELLNSNYDISYSTYDNSFTGINRNLYLEKLAYPLKLSYTSLNSYNECGFKYYLKNVLKLDDYEDTFAAFVGSLYHEILSLYRKSNFDFEIEYNKYLEKRELNLKEKLLLVRIKRDLLDFIEVIKKQDLITGYDEALYEEKVEIDIRNDISVKFIGYIDKIMYLKKVEDTYFSIIDYKTGMIDTHIEPMKYGLHMQLPVYLYLINYGRVFTNPIFTGIYYQNILYPYPSWSLKLDKEIKDRYLLKGYSTDNIEILEKFDSTYQDSEYIKSMKYSDDKFGTYTKLIDDNTLYNLVKYTKNHIEEKVDDILNAKFPINPKVYNKDNVSCTWCPFKDICFMLDKDLVYLEKQDDLSFLGGEE